MNARICTAFRRLRRLIYGLLALPVMMSVVLLVALVALATWVVDGNE